MPMPTSLSTPNNRTGRCPSAETLSPLWLSAVGRRAEQRIHSLTHTRDQWPERGRDGLIGVSAVHPGTIKSFQMEGLTSDSGHTRGSNYARAYTHTHIHHHRLCNWLDSLYNPHSNSELGARVQIQLK